MKPSEFLSLLSDFIDAEREGFEYEIANEQGFDDSKLILRINPNAEAELQIKIKYFSEGVEMYDDESNLILTISSPQ